ncbi:hypothetical protein IOD16_09765 [Saccharothrix sp. 6-C]|uniref:hypothetical protein n=1 Tax=Saccharothrix sp. 6-C TaxID=2781735 RepID=UPI001916E182|nr:hypothetical protein [Saccharothrix sp. 6-C]QQQ78702.1 hypothetical protein IOD16_09765 [Saccharothrix sp. 6-C]
MAYRALETLRRRFAELDADPLPETESGLACFASVMGSYTNTSMPEDQAALVPADADELAAECRLLNVIARDEGGLVSGPLDHERQHWIATARHSWPPRRAHFIEPTSTSPGRRSTKPFNIGMFTSTATRTGKSSWRTYLDLYSGSDLYPLPWRTWLVRTAGSVLEISSAQQWADLVQAYPDREAGLIYPRWTDIAKDYDGVHLTLRAIASTQGFSFTTPSGSTAPAFWDVESTFWLRWCVTSADLIDITTC